MLNKRSIFALGTATVVTLVLLIVYTSYYESTPRSLDPNFLSRCTVDELINGLESEPPLRKLGSPTSEGWIDPFLDGPLAAGLENLDRGIRFERRRAPNQFKNKETLPVLVELVRRGLSVLPNLLIHVTDPRPTRSKVEPNWPEAWMNYSDEYDPRYSNPKKWPLGVNKTKGISIQENVYRIRIGDLCYVAIGQIVNRDLECVSYQPVDGVLISSPVETSSLARAVKTDWAGITEREHQTCLIQDIFENDSQYRVNGAFSRLRFYYPDAYRAFCTEFGLLSASASIPEGHYMFLARYNFLHQGFFITKPEGRK